MIEIKIIDIKLAEDVVDSHKVLLAVLQKLITRVLYLKLVSLGPIETKFHENLFLTNLRVSETKALLKSPGCADLISFWG